MSTTNPHRWAPALVTVLSLALGCTACAGDDAADDSAANPTAAGRAHPGAPTKKGLVVGFVPKQAQGNLYFSAAGRGGEQAVTRLGSDYKESGTDSSTDTAGQIARVEELTEQGADAVVVSAQDPQALCPALKEAMEQGVKVVTYDSDTSPECRHVFVAPVSPEELAYTQVQVLAQQIDYAGDIAILSAAQSATNQNSWISFMREELKDPRYRDMKLVEVAYGDDDHQKSLQKTRDLLRAHPGLKGIISPTTVGIRAAAEYLSGSEFKGKVRLTGLGTPNDLREYVEDGTVEAFELWDPARLGDLAARAAVALASGQITGREGQLLQGEKDGWWTVKKDGVITLDQPTLFNAENIDDYDF
ncbi:rhamnose ABC transporter substrate-binding protein [Streptomyces sp. NPDC032940]|uniref:rhamnose ABC transporter substrate-binding protein n=1 Tax=Streptomyces sp. NPDC032940 TaxID=3155366 RepID=UPI0033C0C187